MGNASGGPHVPSHIHCSPLEWADNTLLDHCLWVVIFDVLDLWYHCLKDTSVCQGVGSPLKVLILGVPILSPAMSMLRRQLTSTSAQVGLEGHCVGLVYLHPFPLWGPLPCHPCQLHCHPQGASDFPGATCVGVLPSLLVISIFRASNTSCSWSSSKCWTSLVGSVWGPSSRLGMLGRGWVSTPTLNMHLNTRWVTAPYSNVVPLVPTLWGQDTEHNGLAPPDCGCSKTMCCGHHIRVASEC